MKWFKLEEGKGEKKNEMKNKIDLPVETYHHQRHCVRMQLIPYSDMRRDDANVIIIHFLLFLYALL